MRAMVDRGHRDVRLARGPWAGHPASVWQWYGGEGCHVRLDDVDGGLIVPIGDLRPAYPRFRTRPVTGPLPVPLPASPAGLVDLIREVG